MIDPLRFCTAALNSSTKEGLKDELTQLAKGEHDVICVLRPKTFTYYDQIPSYHKSQSDETMLLMKVNDFEGQTDFFNAPGIECIKFTGKSRSTQKVVTVVMALIRSNPDLSITKLKPHQDDEIGKAEEAAFCQQCNAALKSINPGSCSVLTSFRMGDSVAMTFRKYSECLAPKVTIPMGPIWLEKSID